MNNVKYLQIPYKYLGRDFKGCDCLGLVQLFYKTEFNLTLPEYINYEEQWYLKDALRITKAYKKMGFVKTKDTPKFGDVLLLRESGYLKHLGVVIDLGCFLHTTDAGTACTSYRQGEYSMLIHSVYRHKGLGL